MSEPNDQTNQNADPAQQPATTAAPTTDVAISGTAAGAVAGDVNAPDHPMPVTGGAPASPEEIESTVIVLRGDEATKLREDLDEIERIALFWGGDRGTQIRNHVCRARIALFGQ